MIESNQGGALETPMGAGGAMETVEPAPDLVMGLSSAASFTPCEHMTMLRSSQLPASRCRSPLSCGALSAPNCFYCILEH